MDRADDVMNAKDVDKRQRQGRHGNVCNCLAVAVEAVAVEVAEQLAIINSVRNFHRF